MKLFFRLAITALLVVFISGCSTFRVEPVYNAEQVPVPTALQSGPLSTIENIIKTAAVGRGWLVEDAGPGKIKATLKSRTHEAVIDILYSKTNYSIEYVSSADLLYEDGKIHRNYNKWVKILENDINKGLNLAALKS